MTTERDPGTRLVLSWLREDAHENAERVLLRALDTVDTTPQRRPHWPAWRRFMPTYAKLVAAAAALVVVAVLGYNLIPGGGVGARSTPAPTASPSRTALPLPLDDTAALVAGDYVTGDPFPVRITSTLPAGWHGHVAGPYYADLYATGPTGGIYFLLPSKVSTDPCDYMKLFTDIGGPTVGDLTAALQRIPGLQVTDVASASIGGYHGTSLVVTVPATLTPCNISPDGYLLWQNPLGGVSPALAAGESIRVWTLDVAGTRLVMAVQDAGYTSAQRAETQAVLDSIRIAPAP